ncbi:CEAM5 protein, partial [Polypterus senegalus]|nr:CEAM5 protein [Polypterus senegalus]
MASEQNLTFRAVTPSDSGRYYCKAQNWYGTENSPVEVLDVHFPPFNTTAILNLTNQIMEGDWAALTCNSSANPTANYSWFKMNGTAGSLMASQQELIIEAVTPIDSGGYYCEARNSLGKQNSTVVSLEVINAPKNTGIIANTSTDILEGSTVNLQCTSNANPVSNYTWFKVNGSSELLTSFGQNLTIKTVSRSDNGVYLCRAQNGFGHGNSSVTLNVQYAPKNTGIIANTSTDILEGSTVNLQCTSNANPVSNYTWFKVNGSSELLTSFGQNLTIQNVSRSDNGVHLCRVQNGFGDGNSSVTLNVQCRNAPKKTSASSQAGGVLEGQSATLNCSSEANPPVGQYTWFRGNEETPIGTGRTLTFSQVTISQAGAYYCQARNTHGAETSPPVTLDVLYRPRNTSAVTNVHGVISAGTSVTLSCTSKANPPATYTWFKVDGPSDSPRGLGQQLLIRKATQNDSGSYVCQAENPYGRENSTALTLEVVRK